MGVRTFIRNITYLFNYSINYENSNLRLIDNLKYELTEDLINVKKPRIKNPIETINEIIDNKSSIARFGDGELLLMLGKSIAFQEYTPQLADRLNEVINSQNEKIYIGIPYLYWNSLSNCTLDAKLFVRSYIGKNRSKFEKLLNFEKQYYATECSQLYMTYNNNFIFEDYFILVKKIWQNRKVVCIKGKGITDSYKYNIFDNVKSIEYIDAPSRNAWSEYNLILEEAKAISNDKVVVIILGPTATVLAYDLSRVGYQALDIGHIAKDYDWYRQGRTKRGRDSRKFFMPD